jgi:S-formylglutathione hydrolase
MSAAAIVTKQVKSHNGDVMFFSHESTSTHTKMVFTVYMPPPRSDNQKCPVLYYLSGLTCTNMNFIEKANAIAAAAEHGIVLVCPDTSPRGDDVPDAPDDDATKWDFGKGAGFYVNATADPWKQNYQMYDYIVTELPSVLRATLAALNLGERVDCSRASIFGHSMGGHGALMIALKNPTQYRSVSAFAPICNPSSGSCPWGDKCFGRYLGSVEAGQAYDATVLAQSYAGPALDVLVDQGTSDNFLPTQLETTNFEKACQGNALLNATVRMQEGYDHSYYFISTFTPEHIAFHAQRLA